MIRHPWDESAWPVVRLDLPEDALTREEFDGILVRYQRILDRGQSFVLLFEIGVGPGFNAQYRDELRRFTRKHERAIAATQRAVGIIASSGFHRASARALVWLVQPPYAVEMFDDWAEAQRWAKIAVRAEPADGARRPRRPGSGSHARTPGPSAPR